MAGRKLTDEEAVSELGRWHDWLVSVHGQTVWTEAALETLRRVVPALLLAIEASAASEKDGVSELVRPPPARQSEP